MVQNHMGIRASVLPRDWLFLGISAKRLGLWSKSGNQKFEKSVSVCEEGKGGVRSFRNQIKLSGGVGNV